MDGAATNLETTVGREYDISEWLQFLISTESLHRDGLTPELERLQTVFEERIEVMLDTFAETREDWDHREHSPDCADIECVQNTAYLAFASIAGHGIGLWEEREPWHEEFEALVEADTILQETAQDIQDHDFDPDDTEE